MTRTLEQRLDRLEALDGVRALKMKYAKLCDAGYPTEKIGALFTAGAVWDGGEVFGRYEGREQIKEFFASADERVDWAMHYTVSGDISVAEDNQTASATWYLWQPMTLDGAAVWLMARYDDKYVVNDDGTWQYSHLTLDAQVVTPIGAGWITERFVGA